MSPSNQASERLCRAARRVYTDPDDADALVDCADQLTAQGSVDAARLIYVALLLQSGASAGTATWRTLAGLSDMRCEAGTAFAAQSRTALDIAIAELGALARIEASPMIEGRIFERAEHQAVGAADPLEDAAVRLLKAISASPSLLGFAEIGAALDDLQREVQSGGALPGSEAETKTAAGVGRQVGSAALRNYLRDVHDFAFAPIGSPALLRAVSHAAASGLGSLGRRTGDLVRHGRDALALLQMALNQPLTTAPETQLVRGVLLLAQRAPAWLQREMIDELADLGLVAPLRALMKAAVRAPDHRRDRERLQRLRDAGLDLCDLQLGWDAQRLLAEGWSDDRNEWQALGDVAAYRGDYVMAERLFKTALHIDPRADHARGCLQALREGGYERFSRPAGFGSSTARRRLRATRAARPLLEPATFASETRFLELARRRQFALPELAPADPPRPRWIPDDGLHLRRLGARRRRSLWGELLVLRGVDAVRGFYVSHRVVDTVSVALGGERLARAAPTIHRVTDEGERSKYVFNLWIDVSGLTPDRHEIELRISFADGDAHVHREHVLVDPPETEASAPTSDVITTAPVPSFESLEQAVNARPSAVRPARRRLFERPPRNVLVMRTDQLGDLICSIPALRRLRELLPEATVTGLVTPTNAPLAKSLKLFDDLIVIDFATDPIEQRRLMPLERQSALEAELHARDFDLAIDLADNSPSRLLLLLSGAKKLYGVQGGDYGFLDLDFQAHARDPFNGSENLPPSNKMLAMIEWLGVALTDLGQSQRREDLDPADLRAFGLTEGRYVVLHTGARLPFSRWPHYVALARLVLEHTALGVVLISDEPAAPAMVNPTVTDPARLLVIDRTPPFDTLDLLLSYCAVFVGNDSGPKHLASLRNVEVVSLHCARNNWNEWGQENTGVVISRRVPCAGCQISDHPDECGKAFVCLTAISPEEVLQAVLARIP